MTTEIWKDVQGYEGIYSISNFGNIYSHERWIRLYSGGLRKYGGKNRICNKNSQGYPCIMLSKDGIDTRFKVHRLVAEHFLEKIDGKTYVNHIDGDKGNNKADNLQWCTSSENQIHAYATGLKGNNSEWIKNNREEFKSKMQNTYLKLLENDPDYFIKRAAKSKATMKINGTKYGHKIWETRRRNQQLKSA